MRLPVKYPYRLYAFPREPHSPASVSHDIAAAAATLNRWHPGVAPAELLALDPAPAPVIAISAASAAKFLPAASAAQVLPAASKVQSLPAARPPESAPRSGAPPDQCSGGYSQATDQCSSGYSQVQLNALHHLFEELRGSIEAPAPFFATAPPEVREALQDLNLLIHRLEDLRRQVSR